MGTVTQLHPSSSKEQLTFRRGDHVEIATQLVSDLNELGPTIYTDGMVYRYTSESHVYSPIEPLDLRKMVHQYAGTMVIKGKEPKPLMVSAGLVEGVRTVAHDRLHRADFFAGARTGLTFANGFVAADGSLHDHSPEHRARFAYPFDFAPNASPKRFLNFLDQVFEGDPDREQKISLLQEYIGTAMLGQSTRYQRMLIQYGLGANGKSVFQKVAESAMPLGSVCAIPPQQMGHDYSKALLAGKLLNVISELPEAEILDGASFKSVISGDRIKARQIYSKPFTFAPIAGHLASANRLPDTADQTEGFWRRMIVLTFNRKFLPDEQNPNLAAELIAAELAEIVSWFIAGAQRMQAQDGYTMPESHQAALDAWRHSADPVREFAHAMLAPTEDRALMLPSRLMYAIYRQWCDEQGQKKLAANRFGERMKGLGLGSMHTLKGEIYPAMVTHEAHANQSA